MVSVRGVKRSACCCLKGAKAVHSKITCAALVNVLCSTYSSSSRRGIAEREEIDSPCILDSWRAEIRGSYVRVVGSKIYHSVPLKTSLSLCTS